MHQRAQSASAATTGAVLGLGGLRPPQRTRGLLQRRLGVFELGQYQTAQIWIGAVVLQHHRMPGGEGERHMRQASEVVVQIDVQFEGRYI